MKPHDPLDTSKAKILIIDDEATNIQGLMRLLERAGYETCVGFSDPLRAVEEFARFTPDLVLLDWHMERMSGLEVLSALRKISPEASLLPVIVLTADCCDETKEEALSAGASDFLSKPFNHAEVLLRIRNLLRLSYLFRQVASENQRLEDIVHTRTAKLRETIVELKIVQQQVMEQDRMRALAAMAGGVAHDFNNSLSVIRGFSDLYGNHSGRTSTPEEMRETFDIISLAAHDAEEIVRRLREFYRPFNHLEEDRQVTALNKLIEETVELTRPKWETQTRAAGICVLMNIELEEDPLVLATPAELREVFINLIFNAVDAMPQGGQITIRSRLENDRILIEMEDTGTGMTDETRQRCLEPFFTTKGDRGTGLGLSIIYGILQRHGATLEIRTEVNKGTCMAVSFPLVANAPVTIEQAMAGPAPHHLRVLMVDDDPLICSVISRLLEEDEHSVTVAGNGCEALEKFSQSLYDVIITDRVMPKMSGDQLATAIRDINPSAPIILLTGFETQQTGRDISLLLHKPVTMDALREALRQVIGSTGSGAP